LPVRRDHQLDRDKRRYREQFTHCHWLPPRTSFPAGKKIRKAEKSFKGEKNFCGAQKAWPMQASP
jgi:hypothetical protein